MDSHTDACADNDLCSAVLDAYALGWSIKTIYATLCVPRGLPRSTVTAMLDTHGVPRRTRGNPGRVPVVTDDLVQTLVTHAQVMGTRSTANVFALPLEFVQACRGNTTLGRSLAFAEADLDAALAAGMTPDAVAQKVGCHRSTVYRVLQRRRMHALLDQIPATKQRRINRG